MRPPYARSAAAPSDEEPLWSDPAVRGLLAIALVALFARLWEGTLGGDAATYAAVAKSMAESGDWLDLRLGSTPYFNKPPLLFWLTALSFEVFGVSTFGACFWSALFGLLASLATYRLGRLFLSRGGALWGALAATLHPDFLSYSSRLRLDSASVLFVVLALSDSVRALRRGGDAAWIRAGLWLALGFLAKGGPALLVLPVIVVFALWTGRGRGLLRRGAGIALLLALVGAVSWPLLQWLRHGEEYAQVFDREVVSRFFRQAGARDEGSGDSWLEYPLRFAQEYWPWAPFALLGLWRLVRIERRERPELFRLLVSWLVVMLALLAFPDPKYGRYLMPVWPAFGLTAGCWIAARTGEERSARVAAWLPRVAAVVAVLLLCLPISLHRDLAYPLPELRPLLDEQQPGTGYVVSFKKGGSLRKAQCLLYLDRELRVIDEFAALEEEPSVLLLSSGKYARRLVGAGWTLLAQGPEWHVFLRPGSALDDAGH